MDAAKSHPADLELRIFPKLGFGIEVPLPVVGGVSSVFNALTRRTSGDQVEERTARTSRIIERTLKTRSNRDRGCVRLYLHKFSHRIARVELANATPEGKAAVSEDIPGKAQARSNKVVI